MSLDVSQSPMTQSGFDSIRRDKRWTLSVVCSDTIRAIFRPHGPNGCEPAGGGALHYVIRRTGRSDIPFLLFGPV